MKTNKKVLKEYIYIILGAFLMALSINLVFDPMDMVTGGISGLAIIIRKGTEAFIDGGLPIWLFNIIANLPLIIATLVIKGRRFMVSTIVGTFSYILTLYVIPVYNFQYEDPLLAAIFGGIIAGVGLGLVIMASASTGGTDLVAYLVQSINKHYSIPQILIILDGIIIVLGAIVFGIGNAFYAIISVYIASKVSDGILEGLKFAKMAYIISDHYEEIAKRILALDRGVTSLHGTGMYSDTDKRMLFCVVTKKEMVKVIEIAKNVDPKSFVIVSDVREVVGEGFIEYIQ
ncbi:MAG TPA: YitT family protein [Clostridiales bacterium]|nr:YitT family protein [Clostridiales bacterium]